MGSDLQKRKSYESRRLQANVLGAGYSLPSWPYSR
jgi:hypothetical protein